MHLALSFQFLDLSNANGLCFNSTSTVLIYSNTYHHADCSTPEILSSMTLLYYGNFSTFLLSFSLQQYLFLKLFSLPIFFCLLFFLHQPRNAAVHYNYSLTSTFISLFLCLAAQRTCWMLLEKVHIRVSTNSWFLVFFELKITYHFFFSCQCISFPQ